MFGLVAVCAVPGVEDVDDLEALLHAANQERGRGEDGEGGAQSTVGAGHGITVFGDRGSAAPRGRNSGKSQARSGTPARRRLSDSGAVAGTGSGQTADFGCVPSEPWYAAWDSNPEPTDEEFGCVPSEPWYAAWDSNPEPTD